MNRAGTTVRVMTWNIHSGVGTDGRFDLTRVVDTIARHHPDVVALQEVDSRQTLAPARSAFAVLRDAVGEHGIDAGLRRKTSFAASLRAEKASNNRAALSKSRSQRPPGHSG